MATLAVQTVIRTGVRPVYNATSAAGDSFLNDGKTWICISNGSVVLNLTIASTMKIGGLALEDLVITVPANQEFVSGMFPMNWFNDGVGLIQMTYDDNSNVVIAVLKSLRE